jgi:hypothetical protein
VPVVDAPGRWAADAADALQGRWEGVEPVWRAVELRAPPPKLYLDGEELVLNDHQTDYVPKARREAQRVAGFLQQALAAGRPELAGRVRCGRWSSSSAAG